MLYLPTGWSAGVCSCLLFIFYCHIIIENKSFLWKKLDVIKSILDLICSRTMNLSICINISYNEVSVSKEIQRV